MTSQIIQEPSLVLSVGTVKLAKIPTLVAHSNMMFLTPVNEGFHFGDFNVVQILFSGERARLTHIRRIIFVCLDMWRGGNMLPHAARLIFSLF